MNARRYSDNILTSFIGNFYPALIALVTGPILAHALGVFGRGEVAAAQAPLALISAAATFGLPEAVTYAVAATPAATRRVFMRAALLVSAAGVLGTAAIIAASGWLSGGVPSTETQIVVAALAVTPTLLLGCLRAVAAATQSWRRIALERIGSSTARLIAILILWALGSLTPLAATVILAAMPLIGALAYLGLPAFRRLPWDAPAPDADADRTRTRSLLAFGMRVWLGSISGIILTRISQVIMTGISSASVLGIYVVAVTVSELPLMINSAVRDVTYATDAAKPQDERLTASARVSFLVSILAAVGIGVTMPFWLPFLFGQAFAPAVPVAAVLLASVVLGTPGSVAGAGLSARGRPGVRSAGLVVACVVNIVLLFTLTPIWGALGAAVASLIGTLIASNVCIWALNRYWQMPVRDFYVIRRSDVQVVWQFVRRRLRRGR